MMRLKKTGLVTLIALLALGPLLLPPKAAAAATEFTAVSSQFYSHLALDRDGSIWAWGTNTVGQFGNGTTTASDTPLQIDVRDSGVPVTFQQAEVGFEHSIALDDAGRIWTTGTDSNGQLGNGGAGSSLSWSRLAIIEGGADVTFTAVVALRWTSLALADNGEVWAWGRRAPGYGNTVLQVPTKTNLTYGGQPLTFTSISGYEEQATGIDSELELVQVTLSGNAPAKFALDDGDGSTPHFQAVSTGTGFGDAGYLALALEDDGELWIWGSNNYGQLGDGGADPDTRWSPEKLTVMDGSSPVTFAQISAGNHYALALDTNGDLWAWGKNNHGQLGDGTTVPGGPVKVTDDGTPVRFTSITAGFENSFALDADGRIWAWGQGYGLAPSPMPFSPTVGLGVSQSTSTYLEEITLTATVSGDLDTPTGTVEFRNGATSLGNAALNASGTATLDVSTLPVGSHNLSVHYAGDDNYTSFTSDPVAHTVTMPDAPELTLTPSTTADTFDPVTVSVDVQLDGDGNGLDSLKWLTGNHSAADFAGSGADITGPRSFAATANGTYTVYARDDAGNETVETISVTNILVAGDASALLSAIADAEQALTDHPQGSNVGQAPAAARTTLQAAINDAQAIADDAANQTQGQIDSAESTLEAATTTFLGTVIGAGNASALLSAIADAEQALTDHPQGSNVGQAPAAARGTLQNAINDAQAIADDAANQTQGQIDSAESTLEAATATFLGTVIGAGDASALLGAIADAEQALTDHPQGSNVGQAPAAARGTLQNAIDDAQAIADDAANQTQGQLDSAESTLEAATATFLGTVIGAGNASALLSAIADAEQALTDHPEGSNVGDAPTAARTTLQDAIDAAQTIADDAANQTQGQLDSAESTLEAATTTFLGTVIGAGNASALLSAIADAEQALTDHPQGSNVGQAPAAARTTLQDAINDAQAIADDAANQTQGQIDSAESTLETATATFLGTVIGAGNASALLSAIADAEQALTDHPQGSNVGQAPAAAR
ncbi:Ig-like domain repeat protein, partial [Paenibacillus sp. IB182496]